MNTSEWTRLSSLFLIACIGVVHASAFDDDSESENEEEDNCPCAVSAQKLDVPGKAVGQGAGAKVSVTGLTWQQSSTRVDTTTHQGKTSLEIGTIIPKVTAEYEYTLAHQNGFVRTNIRRKILVEYTDFTPTKDPGRCYSYAEEPICEDRTETNCTASLAFKASYKHGRGNQTYLDIRRYHKPAPTPSTSNGDEIKPLKRFPKPNANPWPLSVSHDLECGGSGVEYVTSLEWSLQLRPQKLNIYPDFGYSASCGVCPKTYGDQDQAP